MIFPGRLDREVTIQQRTIANNVYGTPVPTWTTFKTTRAGREYIRQSEGNDGDRAVYGENINYWLRYDNRITRAMRLVDGDDTFTIEAIREIGRRENLVLVVKRSEGGRNG